MFPKSRSWGIFVFKGFNVYAEIIIFALRFGFWKIVYYQ